MENEPVKQTPAEELAFLQRLQTEEIEGRKWDRKTDFPRLKKLEQELGTNTELTEEEMKRYTELGKKMTLEGLAQEERDEFALLEKKKQTAHPLKYEDKSLYMN